MISKEDEIWNGEVGKTVNGKDLGPEIIGLPLWHKLQGTEVNKPTEILQIKAIDAKNRTITLGIAK